MSQDNHTPRIVRSPGSLPLLLLVTAASLAALSGCATKRAERVPTTPPTAAVPAATLNVRSALLPPGVHGRLTGRTMTPRYLTIHSTENRGGTADQHARLLLRSGIRSRNNPRFGRSGWVTWHFTVDDREAVEHLLPTEQGDHADYGGVGDRQSIGIEICEFGDRGRQAAAIDRAAHLAAELSDRYGIPASNIVPHMHWPRWDFKYGKPCPHILLERVRQAPGGWRTGAQWNDFVARVQRYR